MRKTYWLYTDSSIFEFTITDEDQDLWQVYLDKQSFDSALKFAKSPKDRNAVYAAQADAYFSQGRYIQSAEAFAQSSKPFEEVVLRFIEKEERDALRYYLVRGLERLKKNVSEHRLPLRKVGADCSFAIAGPHPAYDAGNLARRDLPEQDQSARGHRRVRVGFR